jgi:hypothetical protein
MTYPPCKACKQRESVTRSNMCVECWKADYDATYRRVARKRFLVTYGLMVGAWAIFILAIIAMIYFTFIAK